MSLETALGVIKMLVGYARVSTLDQNPEFQIEELRKAGCEKVFTEKISGAKANRPKLQEALDYMRAGDTLVVWKLSRLARSLSQIMGTVKELQERKIALKVLTQKIDTSTPEGTLFFHINAAFDQFQLEIIVENTKAGLKSAREKGRIGGRPKIMTENKIRLLRAMIKDDASYPFISDVIRAGKIARKTFYKYFSVDEIRALRAEKE
ncbi:MAG: recombinase family protein [Holosporaceae bacterium]|jgi:DNA invertase Pin-like site-specific DNA recombinase|nr:recombinase family protein [Holosporaceae bacterium]